MHRGTKILLIVLGIMIVVGGGFFGYVKITGKDKASADIIGGEGGLKSYFGDTVVIVKDKQTGKPIKDATVDLFGRYDNENLNKYYTYKCSRQTLLTDGNGKAYFTKANSGNNLKTRITGSAVFKVLGFVVYEFKAGTSNCVYNVTVTGPAPLAGGTIYGPYTTTWSWPGKGIDGALTYDAVKAFLGYKGVFLEKQSPGTINATLTLSSAIDGSNIPKFRVSPIATLDGKPVEFITPNYNSDTGKFYGKLPVTPTGKSYKIKFEYLISSSPSVSAYFVKEVSGVTLASGEIKDLGSITLIKK